MNRIYRSVWNEITRTFVAAAETVRGRGKPSSGVCAEAAPASRSSRALTRRRPLPLALEPRFMFDGAAVATADAAAAAAAEAHAAVAAAPAAVEVRAADPAHDSGRKEVVFADTSVANYKTLEAGIRDGVAIVEIDGAKDGLAQIAKWAESHSGYDSIAILGHGEQATLHLGTTTLTTANLASTTVQTELAEIGQALTSDGDLMLYGCDVAKGAEGEAFIADVAAATGADVAASTDTTGAASKGGDWVLEKEAGQIDSRALALSDYQSVLSEKISFSTNDTALQNQGTASITKAEVDSQQLITFSGASGQNLVSGNDDTGAFGFASFGPNGRGSYVKITAPTGYTFDLTSFAATVSEGPLSITLTYGDGRPQASFTLSGSGTTLSTQSGFSRSINDVTAVEISSSGIDLFNDFGISDVQSPPSVGASSTAPVFDTAIADTFFNQTGTLTATRSSFTNKPITSYGISGGTAGTYNIGGSPYQVSMTGGYGTLYVNSETGAYLYDPDDAAINGLSVFDLGNGSGVTRVETFTVTATDSVGATGRTALQINLNGDNDAPVITSGTSASVAENSTGTVYTATASDCDREYTLSPGVTRTQALSYSLAGDDAGLFEIDNSGKVRFKTEPDYESKGDKDGDNVYDVTVTVTDDGTGSGAGAKSVSQAVHITVTDANEAPSGADKTVSATEDAPYSFKTGDFAFADSDTGTTPHAFSAIQLTALPAAGKLWLDANGDGIDNDAALSVGAKIDASDIAAGKLKFSPAADDNGAAYANFSFKVSDGTVNATDASKITINVAAVNDAPTAVEITGNNVSVFDRDNAVVGALTTTDVDGPSSSYTYQVVSVSLGDANQAVGLFDVSGSSLRAAQPGSLQAGTYSVVVEVSDGDKTYRQKLSVTVSDTLTVTTADDSGENATTGGGYAAELADGGGLSLREAVALAEARTGGATIRFDSGVNTVALGSTLAITGDVTFDTDALATMTISGPIEIASGKTLTLSNGDGDGLTLSGQISGGGTLAKTGSGTLTLAGVNNAYGAVRVDGGTLAIAASGALSGSVRLGEATTLVVGATTTLSNAITLDGRAAIDTGAQTVTLDGVISGTGDLVKAGSGTLELTQANEFTGATRVDAGSLSIANGDKLGKGPLSLANGTTLIAFNVLTIGNAVELTGVVTLDTPMGLTLSGVVSGAGSLVKTGSGTLKLTGANRDGYGGTTVSAGRLAIAGDANLGSGAVSLASGTYLEVTAAAAIDNAITLTGDAVISNSAALTLAGVIDGSGALTKRGGGTLTLAGANGYSGTTTVDNGTLAIAGDANLGGDVLTLANGAKLAVSGTTTIDNAITLKNDSTIEVAAGATATLSGKIASISGTLTKAGAGTLTLAGNLNVGKLVVGAGTLATGQDYVLKSLGVEIKTGATFALGGYATLGALSGDGSVALGSGTGTGLSVGWDDSSTTFSGTISGSGGFSKAGRGTLTLTGNNSYTGQTTVSGGGALKIVGGSALADSSSVAILSSSTLIVNDSETIGMLLGSGSVSLGASTLTVDGSNGTSSFTGVISGSGSFVKIGGFKQILSGANTYTGKTTISAGELIVNRVDALSSSAQVFIDGGKLTLASDTTIGALVGGMPGSSVDLGGHTLTLAANSETTLFSGSIGGSGNLVKTGTMTAMLNGDNSYQGTTTISAGALSINGDRNLGVGKVTLENSATLNVSGTTTIDNEIVVSSGAPTITTDSGAVVTLSGSVSGPSLTKSGAGTLILGGSGAKSLGVTLVTGGTLQIDTTLQSQVVAASGTRIGGIGTITSKLTIDSGATLAPGAGGVGRLTLGALVLNGTLAVELAGDSSYDSIVTDGVTYGADSAISVTRVGGYSPSGATTFRLIDNSAATSGAFKDIAQGAMLTYGDDDYTVSYTASGNAGGSASLTLASLPRPAVSGVSAASANGTYKIGDVVTVTVAFDRAVSVSGTPTLTLETGTTDRVVNYASGSGSTTLTFTYTVQSGDTAADLDYASTGALVLSGGTIVDTQTGRSATLTLAAPGTTGSLGVSKAIVIDGNAPTTPGIDPLAAASDSGASGSDGVTVVTTPTLTGVAEAFSTVTLYDGQTQLGSVTADGAGVWTFTCPTLADGPHTLTARATDAAGNVSAVSAALAVTIDTAAPASPATLALAAASDSGVSGSDRVTRVTTPTLTGTAEAFSTVTLYEGNTLLGSATADGSGAWAITSSTLTAGVHTLTARATDAAGNVSGVSAALAFTIDTGAPASPATLALASASDSGASGSDRVTRISTPILSGTAEAFSTVTLYDSDGTTVLGSATADGVGAWTITSSTLADGAHTLTARAMDAAGNVSTASAALALTIDTAAPASPRIAPLERTSDSGASGSDGVTVVTTPTLTGVAEAFSTVTLYEGNTQLGSATADGVGAWVFTCPTLADGAHALTARATDAAGNVSAVSAALAVTIDTAAPASPATLALAAASDSGVSGSDRVTRVTTPTLTGTAEAFSTVTLYEGNTLLGSATADGSGAWSITSSTLADGAHTLTVRATDAAGNVSATSAALALTIDTNAPAAPLLVTSSGNKTSPTISGSAEAFSTVTLYDSDGTTVLGSATADGVGAWTITSSTLADGAHTLTARAMDAAGNGSTASAALALTIDTAAPASPRIAPLERTSDSGASGSDGVTLVTTPILSGTAEAFSTVTLYDGQMQLGSVTADGVGAWVFTCPTLADGAHALTARATDAAGNVSTASAALAVTIDTKAPAAPLLVTSSGNKTSPTISGSAEAFSTVTLYDGQTQLGSATADGAGAWSITSPTLAIGAHTLTAHATDVAGNVSSAASPLSVSVEASVPPPVIATPAVVIPAAVTTTTTTSVGSDVATSTASFLAPASELAPGAVSGVLTALATGTTSVTTVGSLGSALSGSLSASFAVAQTGTAPSAALGSSAAAPVTGLAPAAGEARSSSATAVLTQSTGFQVVVASGSSVAAGDGIVVNRGVSDQSVASGTVTQFAIPADAFAASNVGTVVTLFVRQSDGRPLPGWLHFNAANGSFEGQPPPGYAGDVSIRVTARDAQGHEAVTTFKVKVGGRSANGEGQRAQPERAARVGLAEQLRLAARTHPALERLARLAGWRDAA